MSDTWIAEDLPAYMFNPGLRKPMSDESAQMSAPFRHAEKVTETMARSALVAHLFKLSLLRTVAENNDAHWYVAASREIETGASMVRVRQRVFRLRDVSQCVPHLYHGPCATCDPKDYAIFTRGEC